MSKINKEVQSVVPQKVLHELFDYNGTTGRWVNKINRRRARAGQPVGCVNKSTGYVVIWINGRLHYAHRLAWAYVYGDYPDGEQPFIDHINGIRNDNRIENLKVSSYGENNRNQKMQSRNTSGINGVGRVDKVRYSGKVDSYWGAWWYNENGKQCNKLFSICKLGEAEAKQLAIDYRSEQIRLLGVNHTIIYSERHGQ